MVKKKPFIDKKNSSTYHIVRRSQRDVGGYYDESTGEMNDMPSQFLLVPTPDTVKKHQPPQSQSQSLSSSVEEPSSTAAAASSASSSSKLFHTMKSKLGDAGLLLEDGEEYNYERHMQPITGSGVYFSGDSGRMDNRAALADARANSIPLHNDIRELDRNFDSIALSHDCMDPDIAEALFNDNYFDNTDNDNNNDNNQVEELLDDFCITANEEPDTTDDNYNNDNDNR